jgi:hypothetical protein
MGGYEKEFDSCWSRYRDLSRNHNFILKTLDEGGELRFHFKGLND